MNESRELQGRGPKSGTRFFVVTGLLFALSPIAVALLSSLSDGARSQAEGGVFLGGLMPLYWAALSAVPTGFIAVILGGTAVARKNYYGLLPMFLGVVTAAAGAPSLVAWLAN